MPLFFVVLSLSTSFRGGAPLWLCWHARTVVAVLVVVLVVVWVFGRISTTVEAMADIAKVGHVWCALAKTPGPRDKGEEPTVCVLPSLGGGSVVDGIFGGVGTRVGTGFVAVVVLVFGRGTTMVKAMPDTAMVKRALDARVNVSGPWNEGEEEPTVGVFSSSRALTVVAGVGNMEIGRMTGPASTLGPAFFRKDFFGWVALMPR